MNYDLKFRKTGIKFKPEVSNTEFIIKRFIFDPDDPELGEWFVNNPKDLSNQIILRLIWAWDSENKQGCWIIEVKGPIGYEDLKKLLEPIEEYQLI